MAVAPGGVASPNAYCPTGKTVIGTGFNASIGDVGFVKSYTYFAGAFFSNSSSITVDVTVQAICASVSGASTASADHPREIRAFRHDVTRAKRLRARSQ